MGDFTDILKFLKKKFTRQPESEDEIREFIKKGEEEGVISKDEERMIEGIFELGDKEISEIMIPRVEMVTESACKSILGVRNLMVETGFSRIPIFYDSIDDIIGIAHAKDILRFRGDTESFAVIEMIRLPCFISETKPVVIAMNELQRKHASMAIVTDEHGGVCGLVTIEDIVEEIVGELQDEFDREIFYYKKLKNGRFVFNARIELDEFNRLLDTKFEAEDVNTLAGLICRRLEHIPVKDEEFTMDGLQFRILSASDQRIYRVMVERIK